MKLYDIFNSVDTDQKIILLDPQINYVKHLSVDDDAAKF